LSFYTLEDGIKEPSS